MVSKRINARYLEGCFVLKYCIKCQTCSTSCVFFDFHKSTVQVDVFLSCERDAVFVLSNAHNPLFSIVHRA